MPMSSLISNELPKFLGYDLTNRTRHKQPPHFYMRATISQVDIERMMLWEKVYVIIHKMNPWQTSACFMLMEKIVRIIPFLRLNNVHLNHISAVKPGIFSAVVHKYGEEYFSRWFTSMEAEDEKTMANCTGRPKRYQNARKHFFYSVFFCLVGCAVLLMMVSKCLDSTLCAKPTFSSTRSWYLS